MKNRVAYILLTVYFHQDEDGRWLAKCQETSTSTFGESFEEAFESISEAIDLHIEGLAEIGELERFFDVHQIPIYHKKPSGIKSIQAPINKNTLVQPYVQPVQYAYP